MGEVVYVSAFAMRDSRNPHFLTTEKTSQFSIIVDVRLPQVPDGTAHTWEVGDEQTKRRVNVIVCHREERRTMMVVEVLAVT
jgi:hypothetical protein